MKYVTGIPKTVQVVFIIWLLIFSIYLWNQGMRLPIAPTNYPAANDTAPSVSKKQPKEQTPWNLIVVNRWNPIPENYEVDLIELDGGEKVDQRIYTHLMEMLEAAKKSNLDQQPIIVSAYRTTEEQQNLFEEKVSEYEKQGYSNSEAVEMAKLWVALPDHSEYQLGLAVDINGATYDLFLWLQEHSYRFGFIFRYPGNKTELTGTSEEVWHYRYVGKKAAKIIYEQGICLEEYQNQ